MNSNYERTTASKSNLQTVLEIDFQRGTLIVASKSIPVSHWKLDQVDLLQFTGLHDKNGIPVWENDVVALPNDWRPYIVKWLEGSACFALCRNEEDLVGIHCHVSEGEVIGNIYENSNLLFV